MSRPSWFTCRSTSSGKGEVAIYDDIGGWGIKAKDFLEDLKKLGPLDELTVAINSGGGDVFDGLAIYNALRANGARITTRVEGIAASIASIIAMAGHEISMPESAWMMIHDPRAFVAGTKSDMEKMAETLSGIKRSLVGIYAKRTGRSESEIEQMMSDETWMDGRDAMANGFATYLIESPAIAASVNLSKFHRVPEPVSRAFSPSAKEKFMSDNIENSAQPAEVRPDVQTESHHVRKDKGSVIDELAEAQGRKIEEEVRRRQQNQQPQIPVRDEIEKLEREARARAAAQTKMINDVYRSASLLGLTDECSRLFEEGFDVEQIPTMLIEIKARLDRKKAAVGNLIPSGAEVGFSYEDPKVVANDMAEAITASIVPGYKISEKAREYLNWRPMGFMRAMLEMAGRDTRRMQPADIVNAAMTTSDFPNLLGTSANKIFLGAYDAAQGTYRQIAARRDVPNFQVQDLLRPGDYPTLKLLTEGGEITAGSMGEKKEQVQLKTYARMIQLSRQMLVNDSLGAFGDLAAKAGIAAAQLENATVWGIVTSAAGLGPTLVDGTALFDATVHKNYVASSAALSGTTIATGRAAMRVQKSVDGNALNITPSILAVPAALETTAEQILNPLSIPTTTTTILTPTLRTLNLVVEPLLDGAGATTAWYLFASPQLRAGALVYGGLEGNTGPRVTVDNPFNVDGVQIRVVHDFYAGVADYRFVYKAVG